MGRMYSVEFENQSIATASGDYDLFELAPATNKPIRLHAVYLAVLSETGDAAEEMLRVRIMRLPATVTSGNGTAAAENLLDTNDSAAGFVSEVIATTVATTTGTAINLHSDAFNCRVGWVYLPTPETRPRAQNAEYLVVRLMAAVTDDLTMSGTCYVEEL